MTVLRPEDLRLLVLFLAVVACSVVAALVWLAVALLFRAVGLSA